MQKKRCVFLTMRDTTGFFVYDWLTYEPLTQLGWEVDEIAWDRSDVDWNQYQAVVIRSTWDYQQRPEEFLQALRKIEESDAILFNPFEVCRWNMDKRYLFELERKGVPILPTRFFDAYDGAIETRWFDMDPSFDRLVIKPHIGANADDTFVIDQNDQSGLTSARKCFPQKPFLVQPFVDSIQSTGEFSLFYFGGNFSHAINKMPKSGDFRVQEEHGGVIRSLTPDTNMLEAGDFVISRLGGELLYARVDFVLWQDSFRLMEVELIEPSLYFSFSESAPSDFARALERMATPASLPERKIPDG